MAKSYQILREQSNTIINEVEEEKNTGSRVGGNDKDIIDKLEEVENSIPEVPDASEFAKEADLNKHTNNKQIHIFDLGTNPNIDNIGINQGEHFTYVATVPGTGATRSFFLIQKITNYSSTITTKLQWRYSTGISGIEFRLWNIGTGVWTDWKNIDQQEVINSLINRQNLYAVPLVNGNENPENFIEIAARVISTENGIPKYQLLAPNVNPAVVFITNVREIFDNISSLTTEITIHFSGQMDININTVLFHQYNGQNPDILNGSWQFGSQLTLTFPTAGENKLVDGKAYQLDLSQLRTKTGQSIAAFDITQTFWVWDRKGEMILRIGAKESGAQFIIPTRGRREDSFYFDFNWNIKTSFNNGETWTDWGTFRGQTNEYAYVEIPQLNGMSWGEILVKITDNTNSPSGLMAFSCNNSTNYPIPQFTDYLVEIVKATLYGQIKDIVNNKVIFDYDYFQFHKYEGCNNLINMENYSSYPFTSIDINNGRFESTYKGCLSLQGSAMPVIAKMDNDGVDTKTFEGCTSLEDYAQLPSWSK